MTSSNERTASSDSTPTEVYRWPAADPEPTRAFDLDGATQRTTVLDPGFGGAAAPAVAGEPARSAPVTAQEEEPPPHRRGNRLAGLGISIVGAAVFTALLAGLVGAVAAVGFGDGFVRLGLQEALGSAAAGLASAQVLIPAAVYLAASWLLVLLVGRSGWWAYVLGGFPIALLVYAAGVATPYLVLYGPTTIGVSGADALETLRTAALDPVTIGGALIAREVVVWTGAWIAARARSVKRWNARERAAYDARVLAPRDSATA